FIDDVCSIPYAYYPSKADFATHCVWAMNLVRENATALAWGHQWGCTDKRLEIAVTPYYNLDKEVEIVCLVNYYGGYSWRLVNEEECSEPSLAVITEDKLTVINQSPIKCQLLILTLFGVLSDQADHLLNGEDPVTYALDSLSSNCSALPFVAFEAAHLELTHLFEHMLERLVFSENSKGQDDE
ncbi:unnamed protein product, partial [Dicrocoelium dendriticum]